MAIAAPLIPPAIEGLVTAGGWVLGGLATLFAAKTIADKTTETAQTKTKEKDCSNNEHRGRVQAQEGGVMLVPGAPWDQCNPPPTTQVVTLIDVVQRQVYALGSQYRPGLTLAFSGLVNFCYEKAKQGGLHGMQKWSCSFFNGRMYMGMVTLPDSRRLDLDVLQGSALIG